MPRQADIAGCLLFAGFQGEKDNVVYFSAGFEAFKYTSQRSGAFTVLDPQAEKHQVPEENGFRASSALAFNSHKIVPDPSIFQSLSRISYVVLDCSLRTRSHTLIFHISTNPQNSFR